jgi:hypothetical protein
MNFGKFVQRSTKGLFIFIAVMMVVPLVLWGYMGTGAPNAEELQGTAGTVFGGIRISRTAFEEHRLRAYPSWWWDRIERDRWFLFMMMQGRKPEGPKAEEVHKIAWQNIILLEDAKSKGLAATESETLLKIREVYGRITMGRMPFQEETLDRIARDIFQASPSVFRAWIEDQVLIDKLLTLVTEAEFSDYDKVYDQLTRQQQSVKCWTAAFDPKDFFRDVKPVRPEEVAKYYDANKAKFKVPEKANVSYLMIDYEELKKKMPEPSEDEVKKYYEEHKKTEFQKAHEHAPGEQHRDDEEPQIKPLEEVRAEIPGKIKQKNAEKEGARLMDRINVDLGADAAANGGKYTDDIFDRLKAKYANEGIALVHDVTPSFDRKHVDDVEKSVGQNSTLAAWAFDSKNKVGDISQKISTSKGVLLFRLLQRKESYDPGLTEQIRDRIVKTLQREQIRKRTEQVAANVVQEINTRGFSAGRRKYPAAEWKATRYFKTSGGDPGVDDAQLGQAIRMQVATLVAGKAMVVRGSMLRNPEKQDWAYVLYMEDSIDSPDEDVQSQFDTVRRNLNEEARKARRDAYIAITVAEAKLQEEAGLLRKEPGAPEPATPDPPRP